MLPELFRQDVFQANHIWPPNENVSFATLLRTWDAQQYLYLSEVGYQPGTPSAAFYPLWPLCIKLGALVTGGNHLLSGLLLANVFSLAGIVLLHYWLSQRFSNRLADITVLLLLAFPGALFLLFPFSEALFLLLVAVFFLSLEQKHYRLTALAVFLLPLTRAVGLFCMFPLAVTIFLQNRGKKWVPEYALCLVPLLGFGMYLFLMQQLTGNAFEGFGVQKQFVSQPSIAKLFDVAGFFNLTFSKVYFHGVFDSAIDRVCFFCFLLSLPALFKLNKAFFIYAVPMGIVPAMTVSYMSFTRYTMVIFPMFLVAAKFLEPETRTPYRWLLLAVLLTLQIFLLLLHVNYYWVG